MDGLQNSILIVRRLSVKSMFRRNDSIPADDPPITAQVFADLYAANFLPIKAFLARKGCGASSLDDLAQEAFLRAWAARGRFCGNSSFRTWLFAIARNVLLEHSRKLKIAKPFEEEPTSETRGQPTMFSDELKAIRTAVAGLPPKEHMAMTMVYFDGMRPSEVAEKLGCGHDVFHQRLTSARRRLRQLLSPYDERD